MNGKEVLRLDSANDFLKTDEFSYGSHNPGNSDSIMSLSLTRGEAFPHRMLETIAEAIFFCYQAQCHYRRASNLATDQLYNYGKDIAGRKQTLLSALNELHLGSKKLNESFMSIRSNLMLDQNFPVLTSQIGCIPVGDLEELDISSSSLFSTDGSIDSKQHRMKERNLLKHCSGILRFASRCEDIAAHQRKLLEAVKGQIQAENPSVAFAGYREDPLKERMNDNSHHPQYHQYYQYRHTLTECPEVPSKRKTGTIQNQVSSTPNPPEKLQYCTTNITAAASIGQAGQQLHQYDGCPNPIVHSISREVIPESKDDEFEPLSINDGMDSESASLGYTEQLLSQCDYRRNSIVHLKPYEANSKPNDEEFEPLSINDGVEFSMVADESAKSKPIALSIVEALAPITQDAMLPDSKIKNQSSVSTAPATCHNNFKIATAISQRKKRKSTTSLPQKAGYKQEQSERGIMRARSFGSYPKHQNRQSSLRLKKSKGDKSSSPSLSASSSSEDKSLLSLALGGRNDFVEKDTTYGKGILHSITGDVDGIGSDNNSCSNNGFSFENTKMGPRTYSY